MSESSTPSKTTTESSAQAKTPTEASATPRIRPYTSRMGWFFKFVHDSLKILGRVWLRTEIHGLERLPKEGPFLILPTHTSFIDPPLLGSMIPRESCFLSRDGILKIPLLGLICRNLNTHGIRRGQSDRQGLRVCRAILKAGWPLVYFPEGRRTDTGRMGPIQRGFMLILEGAPGVPYLPVVMQDTYRVMHRGQWFPRPRKVHIHIGEPACPPVRNEGEPTRVYHQRCADDVERRLRDLGAV